MITQKWHDYLAMDKHDEAWHRQDILDELQEYQEAKGVVARWSELSDVVYTYTRARWSGHRKVSFPLRWWQYALGLVYMFPKYTLRWWFFRRVGYRLDPNLCMKEVRNPTKIHKLHKIAEKYGLDSAVFEKACKTSSRYWFFLK